MTRFGSVVCISTDTEVGGKIIKQQLTYGKLYEIIAPGQMAGSKFYVIENDRGIRETHRQSKFVTLEEWREKRIDEVIK